MENFIKNAQVIAWVAATAVACVLFIIKPINEINTQVALIQQAQDTIKSNHLQHLQDLAQDIDKLATIQTDQQKQIIELQKQLIVVIGNSSRR